MTDRKHKDGWRVIVQHKGDSAMSAPPPTIPAWAPNLMTPEELQRSIEAHAIIEDNGICFKLGSGWTHHRALKLAAWLEANP
jgi:hypothetical protein